MKRILLLCCLVLVPMAQGRINFGSPQSAIKVSGSGRLNVQKNLTDVDGTIVIEDNGTVTAAANKTLEFTKGILNSNATEITLIGTYDPNASIKLNGFDYLRAEPGTILESVTIANTQNRIVGQPLFSQPIVFFDAATTLTIAIQNKLNQNIKLNGGTLFLENDLALADGVTIEGTGNILPNKKSFAFGSNEITLANRIFWDNANDLHLNAKLVLSNVSVFNGISTINGHGNILDLTTGGTVFVPTASTLYLTDITVRGLGNGAILLADNTSKVVMSDVAFELSQNYTTSTGGIYVDGPATFVLGDKSWYFDSNGSLTVDGVVLWVDRKTTPTETMGHVVFGSPIQNHFSSINSGTIKATVYLTDLNMVAEDLGALEIRVNNAETNIVNNSNAIVVINDLNLSNSYAIVALNAQISPAPIVGYLTTDTSFYDSSHMHPNESSVIGGDLTINGNGSMIVFSNPDHPQFIVEPGRTVTLENINFQNINANTFDFGACSKVVIGENVIFALTEDVVIKNAKFDIVGSNFTVYGVGGIRHLTFEQSKCCSANYRDHGRRDFDDEKTFNLGDNTLTLKSIEIDTLDTIGNGPLGTIKLTGETILNIDNNSSHRFMVENIENFLRLRQNNITFMGKLDFGEKELNKLNIIHEMPEAITELPIITFADAFAYVKSHAGVAELAFDDDIIRVVNGGKNAFVVGENSFLDGKEVQIWNFPIRQISSQFEMSNTMTLTSNMVSPIEQASGFYVPVVGTLPPLEYVPGLQGYQVDPWGNSHELVFRSFIEPSRYSNTISSFPNAAGVIYIDESIAKKFNIHRDNPLILNVCNGSDIELTNSDVVMKDDDVIIVCGKKNVIHIAKSFRINGTIIIDEGGELIFDFEDKESILYLPSSLSKQQAISFRGRGTIVWLNKEELALCT